MYVSCNFETNNNIMDVRHFSFQNINMDLVTLPELIFSDIMLMVGLESLESLHRCRQVCRTWNEMILKDIWENQSRKKIMKMSIEKNWSIRNRNIRRERHPRH